MTYDFLQLPYMKRFAFLLFAALLFAPLQVRAQGSEVKITITAPLVWLRSEPSLIAPNVQPVAKGQFYIVNARTADNAWWRISVAGSKTPETWLLADLAAPYSGEVQSVPVVTPVLKSAPPLSKKPLALPPWIPQITAAQKAIYQRAVAAGKDPFMFTVVGDCNSLPPVYLQRIASGQFNVAGLGSLQSVVLKFGKAFSRISLAATGGLGAAMMMDPQWADGALCDPKTGQGPFACELWVSRASVVFIAIGTQEQYTWQDFEPHYRRMIEHALAKGVLPIAVTKADDIETAAGAPSGFINSIVRKLAAEYQIPLLDFYAATRNLPNFGLIDEGDKDFHLSYAGMDRRMLATLQTLAAVAR